MQHIEEMLSELQQAGLLDSHGQFSIDFGRALQKMGQQLLPDPRMYVLRFYQSAVCGGSRQVDFTANMTHLNCRSLGPPLPLAEVQQLSSYLAPSAGNLAAHYLATALHAALSTRPRRLQLVTWDGNEGASLIFDRGQESLQILSSSPLPNWRPQTCLMVERGPAWFFRQVPEWEWLRRQGAVGPAFLSINGDPVEPNFGAPRDLVGHKLYLPGSYVAAAPEKGVPVVRCQKGYHVFCEYVCADPGMGPEDLIYLSNQSGLSAAVGIRADLAPKATLRFVRHGVMLPPVQLKAPVPGLDILVSSAGFSTDLSGFALIEDDAYRQTCKDMLKLGEAFWTRKLEGRSYRNCIAHTLLAQAGVRHEMF